MGIDLLDIVYRLEKNFSIRIDRADIVDPEEWNQTVRSKEKTQQELQDEFIDKLTVKFLCDLVEQKIREKNEGADSFPNMLRQVEDSVLKMLSEQFNVSDSSAIKRDFRLEQLAHLSESHLTPNFWKRFHRISKDDSDEWKSIKTYVLSREYVSAWKTFSLSFGMTFVLCVWLWIIGCLWKDVFYFLVVLLVPLIILFGIRFVINWTRRKKPSQVTVGEIIDYLVDQKRDHSVRADGLPYSRVEIEQIVADALVESLAVDLEEIKPEARIIKDLGAG